MGKILVREDILNVKKEEVREEVQTILDTKNSRKPILYVMQVGEDPASTSYIRNKNKVCSDMNIQVEHDKIAETITEEQLIEMVVAANENPFIDGIIVQLPLPKHINEERVCQAVSQEKDVDGFSANNVGKLQIGMKDAIVPCTAKGVMDIVEHAIGTNLSGKRAVVIGRSNIVGKPVAKLLMDANATVTICHSRTDEGHMIECLEEADIIVAAVGIPKFVTEGQFGKEKYDMQLKEDVLLVDVGINRIEVDGKKKLIGDIDPAVYTEKRKYTTVPGGVGLLTCFNLGYNTVQAFKRKYNL